MLRCGPSNRPFASSAKSAKGSKLRASWFQHTLMNRLCLIWQKHCSIAAGGFSLKHRKNGQTSIDGLPEGYEGLLIIVEPGFMDENFQPFGEPIIASSTAYGSDCETIWAFVWPIGDRYNCCGWFSFNYLSDRIIPDNADVHLVHQKQGIASAVYRFVKNVTEIKVVPGLDQSEAACALWKSLAPGSDYL